MKFGFLNEYACNGYFYYKNAESYGLRPMNPTVITVRLTKKNSNFLFLQVL